MIYDTCKINQKKMYPALLNFVLMRYIMIRIRGQWMKQYQLAEENQLNVD